MSFHWAANIFCERLATRMTITAVIGIDTSAMSASCHEIENIMPTTPSTVSTEMNSWLSVCWSVCETLSMSLVTRLSRSPRGCLSKYLSGRTWILSSTRERSL